MKKISNEILKRAVVAGASAALKSKREHPNDSEEEILKRIILDCGPIANKIGFD